MYDLTKYEVIGDPDEEREPTRKELRRQWDYAKMKFDIAEEWRLGHWHRSASGGAYHHVHKDRSDEPGHVHRDLHDPPIPAGALAEGERPDAGPSLGSETPAGTARAFAKVRAKLLDAPRVPDDQRMRWQLRLVCGHVIERTAHVSHTTVHDAFLGSTRCTECGLTPAVIIAARAVGPVAEKPKPTAPKPPARPRAAMLKRLAKLKAEVAALEREVAAPDGP